MILYNTVYNTRLNKDETNEQIIKQEWHVDIRLR